MSQPKIKLVKFLYNNWYGSIKVSNLCREKYKELYNEELNNEELNELDDIEFNRTNNKLLNVINILGLKECRFNPLNGLSIIYVPEELDEYVDIDEYDGKETISINYNLAFSDILHSIMNNYNECEPTFIPDSEYVKYNRIKYIRSVMRVYNFKDIIDPNIFILDN